MIRCNLSLLLAERNLKITKVAADTGISRTTLTSLANNYGQGIQFVTLNTLCKYLSVTPEQFFSYVPFDIVIHKSTYTNDSLLIDCSLLDVSKEVPFRLKGIINSIGLFSNNSASSLAITICYDYNFGDNLENNSVIDKLKSLPLPFFADLEFNIINKTSGLLENYLNPSVTFYWDNQIRH